MCGTRQGRAGSNRQGVVLKLTVFLPTSQAGWVVNHHIHYHGTRYRPNFKLREHLSHELDIGRTRVAQWLLKHNISAGVYHRRSHNAHNKICERQNPLPASIIIPTMGGKRLQAVLELLAGLGRAPFMANPQSEVILAHGSTSSWEARHFIQEQTKLALLPHPTTGPKLLHLNQISLNSRYFTARRFFAGLNATNQIMVQVDDDAQASKRLWQEMGSMICAVASETGFPKYDSEEQARRSGLYGTHVRKCGQEGYHNMDVSVKDNSEMSAPAMVLTGLAAFSKVRNFRFLQVFDQRYEQLMRIMKGNGEDLLFNHAVRLDGGRVVVTHKWEMKQFVANGRISMSLNPTHYHLRGSLCMCFAKTRSSQDTFSCMSQHVSTLWADFSYHLMGRGRAGQRVYDEVMKLTTEEDQQALYEKLKSRKGVHTDTHPLRPYTPSDTVTITTQPTPTPIQTNACNLIPSQLAHTQSHPHLLL